MKSTIVTDGGTPSIKGTAQGSGSGIDFADIIRKNGVHVDGGLNTLSNKAGITGVSERSDSAQAVTEQPRDTASDRNDNGDNRTDGDDRSDRVSDRDTSSQPERPNDYANDRSQDSRSQTTETVDDNHDSTQHADNNGETANRDDNAGDSSDNDTVSNQETGAGETADTADSGDGEQTAAKGEGENENKGANGNKGETSNDGAMATTAQQMLNTLLENTQGNALPGQASGQAQENAQAGVANTKANDGLNTAIASLGKQTESAGANTGQSTSNAATALTQNQTHNLASGQNPAQAQNTANAASQAAGDAQAKDTSKAAEQAAQISKLVGNGNKIDVSVTVTDEKAGMISKPSAALVSGTVLAADNTPTSLRNQQGQGANNAGGQAQAQQVAGQAANAGAATQQAVQQAGSGQSQSANTATIDAKGAVQGTLHTGGAQAALSGSGDTPVATAPGSTTATQQAQQNTSTQAANANRFTTANPALTDQVSVQISKAINAGNDKISIQLKPAEMGRIDVQLEVGQDGRVIAVVTADNKSTLDLLQKDARELQQALQQAGLHADDDSLSFNLREKGDGQMAGKSAGDGEQGLDDGMGDELSLEEELARLEKDIITDSRIDVRA
ncbi:MAG: flagellar hook-length control protein FliK [Rhodospirillaceae bacterium]|nr:flagellar hook-length control protein FliK [Rhodospirillaceae bacterium]